VQHGYDYWALGHVHAREVVATEPWIVFPGNLQGRGLREPGPKGATLVRVSAGRVASVEHRSLDTLRFATVVADTSDSERFDDVLSLRGSCGRSAHAGRHAALPVLPARARRTPSAPGRNRS
jgi:DNA repair exonuclease SbcCD nuclease subunit